MRVMGGAHQEGQQVCTANCLAIAAALQMRVTPSITARILTKPGEPRWVVMTHVVVPAERQQLSALVHILTDVTEEVAAKELVQKLGAFAARVSNSLNIYPC